MKNIVIAKFIGFCIVVGGLSFWLMQILGAL